MIDRDDSVKELPLKGSFMGCLDDVSGLFAFCRREGKEFGGLRLAIGVILATFAFGCKDSVRHKPIPSCTDIDTTPMDELLAERGWYLSARPDSEMSRKDSSLVARFLLSGDEGLAERDDFLEFLGFFHRLQSARRNHELVKICPVMIRESRRWNSADPGMVLFDQNFCASAAFHAGDFGAAMEYLDSSEAGFFEGKIHGMLYTGQDLKDRLRMRAEINSLWRRDREVLRLQVPGLWADRPLRLAILRSHRPEEIPKEFNRAIDGLNIANYEDAPPAIQVKFDSLFEFLGKRKKIGWTRLFGVDMVVWPPGEEPSFGFSREAYEKVITESHLYEEMYCLPNTRDSLELARERERTGK